MKPAYELRMPNGDMVPLDAAYIIMFETGRLTCDIAHAFLVDRVAHQATITVTAGDTIILDLLDEHILRLVETAKALRLEIYDRAAKLHCANVAKHRVIKDV
jgi:hypothetical protein